MELGACDEVYFVCKLFEHPYQAPFCIECDNRDTYSYMEYIYIYVYEHAFMIAQITSVVIKTGHH